LCHIRVPTISTIEFDEIKKAADPRGHVTSSTIYLACWAKADEHDLTEIRSSTGRDYCGTGARRSEPKAGLLAGPSDPGAPEI
jgi:hypothetical protein